MDWTAFDLAKKKTVNADLKYWFGAEFMYCHSTGFKPTEDICTIV